MKTITKIIPLICFLCFFAKTYAQVYLTGLGQNAVIKEYLSKYPLPVKSQNDTLHLPFFEDFLYSGPYPSSSFWEDNFAFVNRSFAVMPPSAGVVTLDALNQSGELYPNLSQNQSTGDVLTSKIINLKNYTIKNPIQISTADLFYYDSNSGQYLSSDSLWYVSSGISYNCNSVPVTFNVDMSITYIWHHPPYTSFIDANSQLYYFDNGNYVLIPYYFEDEYNSADSIYMSFYYQPQGYSENAPETNDSLILQFCTDGSNWHTVWRAAGTTLKGFSQVMMSLSDSIYLVNNFQFRFYNLVSSGGTANPSWNNNCDFWNIDYIYINKNRSHADTIPDDVCLADQRISFLKKYTNIPWEHFKEDPSLRKDTLSFTIRNLSDVGKAVNRKIKVFLYPNNLVFNPTPGNENILAFSDSIANFPSPVDFFSAPQSDSAHFTAQVIVSGGLAQDQLFFGKNDTIYQEQYFHNYYAYDDGTAENGFGLGGIGTQNALLAYRFVTLKPDSLRGVYMFFNQTINNASQKYFYLTIWNNYAGRPYSVVHDMIGQIPEYEEGMYKFHYYLLDTAQWLTDTFYIGWKQTTTDLLNIGFDANNNNRNNILYNIAGAWEICPFEGSLLMRPVFSSTPFLNSPVFAAEENIYAYPNPNSGRLFISNENNFDYQTEIFDLQGRLLYSGHYKQEGIDTSPFDNGIYMIRITTEGKQMTQKIVIQN